MQQSYNQKIAFIIKKWKNEKMKKEERHDE